MTASTLSSTSYVQGRGKPLTWLPRQKLAEVEQEANKPEKATERQAKLREAKEITREEKKFDGKTKKHRSSNEEVEERTQEK